MQITVQRALRPQYGLSNGMRSYGGGLCVEPAPPHLNVRPPNAIVHKPHPPPSHGAVGGGGLRPMYPAQHSHHPPHHPSIYSGPSNGDVQQFMRKYVAYIPIYKYLIFKHQKGLISVGLSRECRFLSWCKSMVETVERWNCPWIEVPKLY